jgi:integrase
LRVADLCQRFIDYRAGRPLSRSTKADDRYIARLFAGRFGTVLAHEVTPSQLRSLLDAGTSESNARNRYKVLSTIYKYAQEEGIVVIHPLAAIRRPTVAHAEPGILKPEAFGRLLRKADAHFPELTPYLATAGFAGVRREELLRETTDDAVLQWSDILWAKRLIEVRPEVAKRTRRKSGDRRYIPMEDALIHWLEPHRKETGGIAAYADSWFRKRFAKLCQAADYRPIKNGLRHSYASHWLARSGKEGVGRLALNMGNSEAIVKRHYVEILTPEDGAAWFNLCRA